MLSHDLDSDAVLEGELQGFGKPALPDFKFKEQAEADNNKNEHVPDAADAPADDPPPAQPAPTPMPLQLQPPPMPRLAEPLPQRSSCAQKPAEVICRLQRGEGSTTGHVADLVKGALPRSVQAPLRTVTIEEEFKEEAGNEGEHEVDIRETEYGMLAENMDPEELDPQSIEECQRRSDWSLWDSPS